MNAERESTPCAPYLARLGLEPLREAAVRSRACAVADAREAMATVHADLGGSVAACELPAMDSIAARLSLALDGDRGTMRLASDTDLQGHARLVTTPRFNRSPMAPKRWLLNPFSRAKQPAEGPYRPRVGRGPWAGVASLRRAVLLALVLVQTIVGAYVMAEVLPYKGTRPLELGILALFVVLFGWISSGFWTAIAGFVLHVSGRDRHAITSMGGERKPLEPGARTAIVMPICNEDVARVFAGLRASCESLEATGQAKHFDVFVLSDTGNADARVAETAAWLQLRRELGDTLAIHYRWRQHHIKKKSGNIADFCRRWGKDYRYMVVLDADSVMSGDCLVRLAQLMEANPGAGIIQTAPRAFGRDTLFARIQQFATAAYGPLFTAGLHFWQLGEAHYWGHNAILRVEPFMAHCALGRLPGTGALSGEILSHDFVEAALMRRAGWAVWIAYDLPGSYEEMPPNLIDELARDRRWCLGNLMNLQLFKLAGLHPAHRAVFMIGVMAYVSAPLWFLALVLGTVQLAVHKLALPKYFTEQYQLFPTWPQWQPDWALTLFGTTAFVLFAPKALAVLAIWLRPGREFGRGFRAALSVVIETLTSALFAPIRMLFHAQFVVNGLAGVSVGWKSPSRADSETGWGQALARHGWHTLLGVAWAGLVWYLDPDVIWWVLPVAGALILSIPLSVFSSRVQAGRSFRESGLFVTPEELHPTREILRTRELVENAPRLPGLLEAVVDPLANALACASATPRERCSAAMAESRARLVIKALSEGPDALSAAERGRLLGDAIALSGLHFEVWTSPAAHASWVAARELPQPAPARIATPRAWYHAPPAGEALGIGP